MKAHRLVPLFIALVLLTLLAVAAGAQAPLAPTSDGCQFGGDYDPACDVNHDGHIDVYDIQLAAGHWSQDGTFTSDNDHNHLGQTWVGNNNPLVISGTFQGWPDTHAPLMINNAAGSGGAGVSIVRAPTGLFVGQTTRHGIQIAAAGDDGVMIQIAGNPSTYTLSADPNAFEVGGVGGDGLFVGRADMNGVHVHASGTDGVRVEQAGGKGVLLDHVGDDGIHVGETQGSGLYVESAANHGVYVGKAGDAIITVPSSQKNGFEVAGAENDGLYVGRADENGVVVHSAGGSGVVVGFAAEDGVAVDFSVVDGVQVSSAGWNGVRVVDAGVDGVYVDEANRNGVTVGYAGGDGVSVGAVGNGVRATAVGDGVRVDSLESDGLHVESAGDDGLEVESADDNGVHVGSAGNDGITIGSAGSSGVYVSHAAAYGVRVAQADFSGVFVSSTGRDGVNVSEAGQDGVYANTTRTDHQWGIYTPDKIYAGTTALSGLTVIAQVTGRQALNPGDVVAAVGVTEPLPDSDVPLALVQAAKSGSGVIGVVEGRMALTPKPQPEDQDELQREPMLELRSAEGPAMPGDYVALTVLGVAHVKVEASAEIQPGQRLTMSDVAGKARALRTKSLDGMLVSEGAPTIGIALAAPEPGKDTIPVFVTLR